MLELVRPVLFDQLMKRIDKKKLQLNSTTIRLLQTNQELQAVAGGASAGCSVDYCPMSTFGCSKAPGCQ